MREVDYVDLQRRYGGRFIARRESDVIASARTYDDLADTLDQRHVKWAGLIIEYVEPVNAVGVY